MNSSTIFLIGYMGCGKTTLGKKLAEKTGFQLIDIDRYIELREGKTIPQLFEQLGEAEFRKLEQKALQEVGTKSNVIISTGGGAPCHLNNIEYMLKHGIVVYLECSIETLFKRLKQGREKRPLIQNKSDEDLLSFIKNHLTEREPFYQRAQIRFNADKLECAQDISLATLLLLTTLKEQ